MNTQALNKCLLVRQTSSIAETASRAQMCHQLQNIQRNAATKQANEQQTSDNTA